MAMRRLTGHASGLNVLQILDLDRERQTVYWWEKRLYQNRLLQIQSWYASHHELLRRALGRPISGDQWFSFEVNRVRMDATNSAAAQRYKAHVLELFTEFWHFDDFEEEEEEDGEDAVAPPDSNSITAFAPLQKLPDPCSGREVHALALKQITSLGALSWLQSLCTDDAVVQDTSTSTKKLNNT